MYVIEPVKAAPFEFQTTDGATHAIPAFAALPTPVLEEFERTLEQRPARRTVFDAFTHAFVGILQEHAPGVAETLAAEQLVGLAPAYFDDARTGASAGESSGSSD